MAAKEIALLLVFVLAVFGEARHVHPRIELLDDTAETQMGNVIRDGRDPTETEVPKIMPKLPAQSGILFFKSTDPCEDGFKQDFQGICREVW